MARTLRQHVAEARRILSEPGCPTILPSAANIVVKRRQKKIWRRDPKRQAVRPNVAMNRLIYAVSVRVVVEKFDRTGWAKSYLEASDAVCGEVWKSIPVHAVCPLCFGRVPEDRGKGRVFCKSCGEFVRPKQLQGLVSKDLADMSLALSTGEIRVRAEKGERG
jgi:hypothetical protein